MFCGSVRFPVSILPSIYKLKLLGFFVAFFYPKNMELLYVTCVTESPVSDSDHQQILNQVSENKATKDQPLLENVLETERISGGTS